MLHRLAIRDFVIVDAMELDFASGLTVLTGETGAGKSILVDALQLVLGARGDAGVVREGAVRTDLTAEFDVPASLADWLSEGGFDTGSDDDGHLLLRRTIDAQGKSRAWINGAIATVTQLREAGERLVDIHGQHAWQSLTRAASVRAVLDAFGRVDVGPLGDAWLAWRAAAQALAAASEQQEGLARERERLDWQIGELAKLAPGDDEWSELDAEHSRLAHAQTLIDATRSALEAISGGDGDGPSGAETLTGRALDAVQGVAAYDPGLDATIEALNGAQAQLSDAAHALNAYLGRANLDPERLRGLDERMSAWVSMARRYRRQPDELPALLRQWQDESRALEAAADLDALRRSADAARSAYDQKAARVTAARCVAAPLLGAAVTRTMQQLGMSGGRFQAVLHDADAPQSFGIESAEFLVAGHAGSTPRPLAKVASGGELSRIALAVAVVTIESNVESETPGTLIFDEVDAGVGGAVAETVGRLMKQLGRDAQVLAVTHLPQVAACADQHFVVSKAMRSGSTCSEVTAAAGETRVAEIARMLGGETLSSTSLAHAQEMLSGSGEVGAKRRRQRKLPSP